MIATYKRLVQSRYERNALWLTFQRIIENEILLFEDAALIVFFFFYQFFDTK